MKVGKKSIAVPHIRDFSWSPTDNIIAYWTPEVKQKPAHVALLGVPQNEELSSRNIFQGFNSEADAEETGKRREKKEAELDLSKNNIFWQKCGDHLCVEVDRLTKVRE